MEDISASLMKPFPTPEVLLVRNIFLLRGRCSRPLIPQVSQQQRMDAPQARSFSKTLPIIP
jgi:hypothetical protein